MDDTNTPLLEGIDIEELSIDIDNRGLDEFVDELEKKLNETGGNNLLINIGDIVKKILLLITTNCTNYINNKFNNNIIIKSHIRCKQSNKINTLYNLLKDGLQEDGLEKKKQEVYKLLLLISSKEEEKKIIERKILNSKKRDEIYKSLKDDNDNILEIINIDDNDNYLYIVYNTINIYNKLCENGIILSEIEPSAKEPSKNIKTIFKDIKKDYFVTHKKSIMCMIAVEYITEMVPIMNRLIDNERLGHLIDTFQYTLKDFTDMRIKYEEYIKEKKIIIEGLQNGGNAKVTKINKKEILGRERCIYKKAGDRKEYLKHKGELITVKDYKKQMKVKN